MKIIFLGSGAFGLPTLKRLVEEHEVVAVVTALDKPAGRNRTLAPTPIGVWAEEHHLHLIKCENINASEHIEQIKTLEAEMAVVIAFGQKLSSEFVSLQPIVNLHASLLPRWRGAAPIHASILNGDEYSGLSVISIAPKMDAGQILGQLSTPIGETETTGELHDRLAELGPDLILEVLRQPLKGEEQDESKVTYASKISRNDARLDLTQRAEVVARTVRGFSPWPACHLSIAGIDCKILNAIPKDGTGEVGEVLEDGTIAVGEGSIEILRLKPSGSASMTWKDFCNGRSIQKGVCCEVLL